MTLFGSLPSGNRAVSIPEPVSALATLKSDAARIGTGEQCASFECRKVLIRLPRRVEVTWIDMDAADASLAASWQALRADERERASRFRFAADRRRFIVRRGALRALLALRLGCPASAIRYSYNEFGKPAVAGSGIRFNVSHSHSIALYAIADDVEVGCDIERVDPGLDIQDIAERFFAPEEISMLRSLPGHLRRAGFFNCWTRKEAYLKCRGCGLSMASDSCVVSLVPGEPAALLAGGDGFSLSSLETAPGYRAALAVEAMDVEISRISPRHLSRRQSDIETRSPGGLACLVAPSKEVARDRAISATISPTMRRLWGPRG